MPQFSQRSLNRLKTCHLSLQQLFTRIIQEVDCTILCGHRGEIEQEEAYRLGLSKLKYPHSKHNANPSLAIDVVPYPINWTDTKRFYFFGGYVKGIASMMGIKIRWGGDWDSDNILSDQTFFDFPHFELEI